MSVQRITLQKLNAFDLPGDVVASLQPLNISGNDEQIIDLTPSTTPASAQISNASFQQDLEEGKTIQCSYCGVLDASTVQELRNHYKRDYHRFNIRRRARDQPPVTEQEFEKLSEELDESISGSDASSDEDDEVSDLMKKTTLQPVNEDEEDGAQQNKVGSPYLLFTSSTIDNSKCLGIFKALVPDQSLVEDPLAAVKSLDPKSQSLILMLGGGHFSGAIIKHAPDSKQKPTVTNPYAHIQITHHKGFHRYTTRRKQGGSQASHDGSGGKANSAGSTLRRYNEQALQQEVRDLLDEWRGEIQKCSAIYVRANGKHNRSVLMNYDKAPVISKDPRVRGLPFVTARATATEIKRAWVELTTARILSRPTAKSSKPSSASSSRPTTPRVSSPKPAKKNEQTAGEKHTAELVSLVKRSRSPKIIAYLRTHSLNVDVPLEPHSQYAATPTLLFYAASQGAAHVVTTLLTTLRADPTLKNANGRSTAFDIAADRATRDAFQLARHTLGEQAWDWTSGAHVGDALSRDQIAARAAQEQDETAKQRQHELDKLEQEEMKNSMDRTVRRFGQGKKLVSSTIVTTAGPEQALRGLSDDARARLERERRARAAEARFKK